LYPFNLSKLARVNPSPHFIRSACYTGRFSCRYIEGLLVVIKCIYLPPTYIHFIQDIEDRCLLLTSSMSLVDLPFQEYRMTEKHHSSTSAQNCQCSTSSGVFSRYRIYIFPREEGSRSCLRLTQGVIPTSTTRQYRGYVNWD
jgi:hypothetical protein